MDMTPDLVKAAQDKLMADVYAPVFFQQLAARGYAPQDEKQAADMLDLAGQVAVAQRDPRVQATEQPSAYKQAADALQNVLGSSQQDVRQSRWNVAVKAASDPAVYNSVLALRVAEAERAVQTLANQRAG